jgi:hypothetical protein
MDKQIYSPSQFGKLIGRSVTTLQRWDTSGILKAHRWPTNRRFYTHDQYLEILENALWKGDRMIITKRPVEHHIQFTCDCTALISFRTITPGINNVRCDKCGCGHSVWVPHQVPTDVTDHEEEKHDY